MWDLTKVSWQDSWGRPLCAWTPHSAPKAPGPGLKAPRGCLETEIPGRAWALDRGFLRRKGKGHTLGGQADGNSWQHWLPSSRAGLRLGR